MATKFNTATKVTAVLSLVLFVAVSAAWAVDYYSNSQVIFYNAGGWFHLVNSGQDKIKVTIPGGVLNDYMDDQGVNEVEITADVEEQWIDTGGGNGYYQLTFVFGPSGAYFTPRELELELRGKYVSGDTTVELYDENGEVLEFTTNGNGSRITYYILHFSSYYYDDYDY